MILLKIVYLQFIRRMTWNITFKYMTRDDTLLQTKWSTNQLVTKIPFNEYSSLNVKCIHWLNAIVEWKIHTGVNMFSFAAGACNCTAEIVNQTGEVFMIIFCRQIFNINHSKLYCSLQNKIGLLKIQKKRVKRNWLALF